MKIILFDIQLYNLLRNNSLCTYTIHFTLVKITSSKFLRTNENSSLTKVSSFRFIFLLFYSDFVAHKTNCILSSTLAHSLPSLPQSYHIFPFFIFIVANGKLWVILRFPGFCICQQSEWRSPLTSECLAIFWREIYRRKERAHVCFGNFTSWSLIQI